MLDGFDEISPNYKQKVIDLLQALRPTAVEQLPYTLEPFSEENQVEFLKKFFLFSFFVSNGLVTSLLRSAMRRKRKLRLARNLR